MKTDYKFWYITRQDNVHISEAAVRFYEGDITTKNEWDSSTKSEQPVTRYRRTKKLETKIYTSEDFGVISDDDELRAFLNGELKKDTTRDNIDEQVEEDVEKLKKLKIK